MKDIWKPLQLMKGVRAPIIINVVNSYSPCAKYLGSSFTIGKHEYKASEVWRSVGVSMVTYRKQNIPDN